MQELPDFNTLSDEKLERLIDEVTEQETKVSFERRTLHGRLDILRAERTARRKGGSLDIVDVDKLARILSRKASADERAEG